MLSIMLSLQTGRRQTCAIPLFQRFGYSAVGKLDCVSKSRIVLCDRLQPWKTLHAILDFRTTEGQKFGGRYGRSSWLSRSGGRLAHSVNPSRIPGAWTQSRNDGKVLNVPGLSRIRRLHIII